jgi:hypothetical protein
MPTTRRDFLQTLGAGAVAYGALPLPFDGLRRNGHLAHVATTADPFDFSWPTRLRGAHKAVFDVATIDSGFGVWRATLWERQYKEFLGAKPADLTSVIVIRAEAIILAMQQQYWDAYHPGHKQKVTHPLTQEVTNTNPVLMTSARKEVPPDFDDVALDQYLRRGGIVLACNLAFRQVVETIEKEEKIPADQARTRAIAMLVPGVMLQPSGIFAVVRAQEAGAPFVRAS